MLFPNARARRTLGWLVAICAAMATLWAVGGYAYAQASTVSGHQRSHPRTAAHKRPHHGVLHKGGVHHKGGV